MQSIPFSKMNGSGNDFVMIDHRESLIPEEGLAAWVRAVCRRGLGLGADGVILIEQPDRPDVDFAWRYINADGSVADLCGNGAMCGARFAVTRGIASPHCRFSTPSGVVTARVSDNVAVTIDLVDSGSLEYLRVGDRDFAAITIGVPHVVAIVDDADAFADFHSYGRSVRGDRSLGAVGANVNLVHRVDERTIRMRTYERGVEAETLACGTGAAASAIVAVRGGLVEGPVRVVTSSGRVIEVSFAWNDQRAQQIRLTGEARFVAEGVLHPEAWDQIR